MQIMSQGLAHKGSFLRSGPSYCTVTMTLQWDLYVKLAHVGSEVLIFVQCHEYSVSRSV